MADPAEELRVAERRLQAAQLAGDADTLDQLLDDRLIFTLGVDGKSTPSKTSWRFSAQARSH